MIKKFILVVVSLLLVSGVCFAEGFKVDYFSDSENNFATIDVLENDSDDALCESDTLLKIQEGVDSLKSVGIEKIALRVCAPFFNEENAAKLIDGIDFVCVYGKTGENKAVGNSLIVYERAALQKMSGDNSSKAEESRSGEPKSISSMLTFTIFLLVCVLILYFILKKIKTNTNNK